MHLNITSNILYKKYRKYIPESDGEIFQDIVKKNNSDVLTKRWLHWDDNDGSTHYLFIYDKTYETKKWLKWQVLFIL